MDYPCQRLKRHETMVAGPKDVIEALLRLPFGVGFVDGLPNTIRLKAHLLKDELIRSLVERQISIGAQNVAKIFHSRKYK